MKKEEKRFRKWLIENGICKKEALGKWTTGKKLELIKKYTEYVEKQIMES